MAIHLCTAPAPAPPRREISTSSLRNGRPDGCGIPRPAGGSNAAITASTPRPHVDGKFFGLGTERLWLRGVTYGTFAPDEQGLRFGAQEQVRADFTAMAANGMNAVRTYTAPPRWLLDEAAASGLWVVAGLAWEQHIAFLDERGRAAAIEASVREQAAECAGHPAVLSFAVGNEIPTPLVRWHGRRRVEAFIERLCGAVRAEAPDALLTYVNYPSTEYLRLPFLDFLAFNVYLDDSVQVTKYLARLQNLAGEKPLVLAEVGADSRRAGPDEQADTLASQLEAAATSGCAGAFVFAWTDEWHRGEDEVRDWHFGLTDRARRPKPALAAVSAAYAGAEGVVEPDSPLVSVIVCTHNGERWLGGCLQAIASLRYPAYETIVVDDGSTDLTAAVADSYGVRVIRTENQGLSAARNVGLLAARGDYVAYIDDDAYPDRDWLRFLVGAFGSSDHAAIGGPNLPPAGDDAIAACVANAPGGPVHVLLSDSEAEHIPGCNMAFRRADLVEIGGFDEQFRTAGDDVDVCWRLAGHGRSLGFHPAAVVWHHRRDTIRAYLRQQRGYGHAEALLERKWPEKYTRRGHLTWKGRLYDRASGRAFRPSRIYHGTWGTGAFQPAEDRSPGAIAGLVGGPDWYLLLAGLAAVGSLGVIWTFFVWAIVALGVGVGASIAIAGACALRADLGRHGGTRPRRVALRSVVAVLHILQPGARLGGRLAQGLSPWRRHPTASGVVFPRPRARLIWHESWFPAQRRVERIEQAARQSGARVVRGGPYATWDLELSGGALGAARVLVAVEEHGRGRQLVRSRVWQRFTRGAAAVVAGCAAVAVLSAAEGSVLLAIVCATVTVLVSAAAIWEAGVATATALAAMDKQTPAASDEPAASLGPRPAPWPVQVALRPEES